MTMKNFAVTWDYEGAKAESPIKAAIEAYESMLCSTYDRTLRVFDEDGEETVIEVPGDLIEHLPIHLVGDQPNVCGKCGCRTVEIRKLDVPDETVISRTLEFCSRCTTLEVWDAEKEGGEEE